MSIPSNLHLPPYHGSYGSFDLKFSSNTVTRSSSQGDIGDTTSSIHDFCAEEHHLLLDMLTNVLAEELNAKNIKGETPLMVAIKHKRSSNVLILLNQGANFDNLETVKAVIACKDKSILEIFVKKKLTILKSTKENLIQLAIEEGCSLDFIKLLVKEGCNVHLKDSQNRNALFFIKPGQEDIAKYLIDERHIAVNILCNKLISDTIRQFNSLDLIHIFLAHACTEMINNNKKPAFVLFSERLFAITGNKKCLDEQTMRTLICVTKIFLSSVNQLPNGVEQNYNKFLIMHPNDTLKTLIWKKKHSQPECCALL